MVDVVSVSPATGVPRPLRWLEWTPQDPHQVLGGIETHILSMAECLRARGIEVQFSSDQDVLFQGEGFDVIRTHGDLLPKGYFWRARRGPIRVHTLHGSSLGKAFALGQLHKYTHWKAFYREFVGMCRANLLASIHPALSLFALGKLAGKSAVVHWNGWDARGTAQNTREFELGMVSDEAWVIAGRLWDKMKGTDRALQALEVDSGLQLCSIPGEGMPEHPRIQRFGRVSPTELHELLKGSRGLLLTSRYEGLSLVLLEALAAGVPVVATQVGGNGFVDQCQPKGLAWFTDPDSPEAFVADLAAASRAFPLAERTDRATWNQEHLWSWQSCTDRLLDKVLEIARSEPFSSRLKRVKPMA